MKRTLAGFGFGAIQGGLFLYEAFRSGNFGRFVVAEVMPDVVAAVRGAGGWFGMNIATPHGIVKERVGPVEILNPADPSDRSQLVEALAEAEEIATALPSVDFFDRGPSSVARLLAEGFARRPASRAAVVYAAENHNHAAELLEQAVRRYGAVPAGVQFLNTVIGKMSGVVTDPAVLARLQLLPATPGAARAFLVEEFNRILVTAVALPGFRRGIEVFVEKPDLLPFEEAKLYGHNATHALLGYLANERGLACMSDVRSRAPDLLDLAHRAFLEESGVALVRKHAGVDPLFTEAGYRAFAEDLLERMMNPHLEDQVARVIRDPQRKLGWDDRLVGTMRVALDQDVEPRGYARGAASAARLLQPGVPVDAALRALWHDVPDRPAGRKDRILELVREAAR